VLAALAVIALAAWLWHRARSDSFDYEAAFEATESDAASVLIDVPRVAGKTVDEVQAVLGAPESCVDALHSRVCRYRTARAEIQFINGKADWISVSGWPEVDVEAAALKRLGLAADAPTEQTETELIWRDWSGYKEVRLVSADGRVFYARIKVATP
jgi:hypothetical protein